jgi:hypothetical protein
MRTSRPPIFHVFLVSPSKYDDDGFVIRHWRGVLPSNTLACLYGLSEDVRCRDLLGGVDLRTHLLDERVTKLPLEKIIRLNRRPGVRVVVGLVGVQTNQFCRAADIALSLRREGVTVLIGGFHVSGVLALFPDGSPEIQKLLDAGVCVVAGEVEHRWADLLRDAYEGNLQPIYNFLDAPPDLSYAPGPLVNKRYLRKFACSNFSTMDCSRGCPFNCSFCSVITVQGRRSRYRSPECIVETLRHDYLEYGVNFCFFTDDNFARNPVWEQVFDKLIQLREQEGIPIEFMIQADVRASKISGFVEKAAKAGCTSVFIGVESLNARNLQDAGKTQNRVSEYKDLIDVWRHAHVSTHVSYMIGLPFDTEESVREDVARLTREIRADKASFFMMTPIPGSRDHKAMVDSGVPLDADYNTYDSFHECMPHPNMKNGAWTRAFHEAWRRFYSPANMRDILSRVHRGNYWAVFRNCYWTRNSLLNEGAHPMVAGFFPLKDRKTRRPGFQREGRLAHWRRRVPEVCRYVRNAFRIVLEMEELWLETREHRAPRLRETRRDLESYWNGLRSRLRQGKLAVLLRVDRIVLNGLREIRLASAFLFAFATARG